MDIYTDKNISAGLIAMGVYLPAKPIPKSDICDFIFHLNHHTYIGAEYIDMIENSGCFPGSIETNYDGWEKNPWFSSWLDRLPPKKRDSPFQGAEERRRVPLDPVSVKRSICPHPMLSSDAEVLAGAQAIFNANIDKDTIDLLLVSSLVPDRHVPLNASLVQHKLKLSNAGAYNIDTCCSSFITMLEIAMSYVHCGLKRNVLIIGSAVDSHINDKSTYYSPITGDAAVAGIVSSVDDGYGYISSHSMSQGSRHAAIVFAEREPELQTYTTQKPSYRQEYVTFNDPTLCKEIAKHAIADGKQIVNAALEKVNYTSKDIDFFVTHQPVHWAANAWREAIGIPTEKYHETFQRYGNIAVASVACNLLEAIEEGKIQAGNKVMMMSSGVGENHIALIHRVPKQLIEANKL